MSKLVEKSTESDDDSETGEVVQTPVVEAPVEEEEDTTLANSDVLTKYQEAAKIANAVLRELIALVSELSFLLKLLIIICVFSQFQELQF